MTHIEHSDNYSITLESLSNYYKDKVNDENNDASKERINNNKTTTSKSFE